MDDKLLKYFHGDDFAASTWENKYALRKDGELIEHSPDEMHMRLAKKFGDIESRYRISDSPYTSDHYKRIYADMHKGLGYETIYELFKNFEYIIPAGSVMSGLGSEKPVSLSNCFVLPSPKDSYPSIMETRMKQVELMKRRGGVGYDLSNLRPRGAAVNNAAITSTGAASFMDVNSDVTNEVSQNGRRGALMLSINVQHPDVEEFIEKKQDLTKVTGANVSVQVTDEFMKAVEKDEDYLLRWPVSDDLMHVLEIEGCGIYLDPYKCEKLEYGKLYRWEYPHGEYYAERRGVYGYIKKVRARDLWNKIIHCAWNTAEPGIIFRDSMINFAPDGGYEKYRMVSTNPCGEIGMDGNNSCRLIALNLLSFVDDPFTENARINTEKTYGITYAAMRLCDDLVDLECEAVENIINAISDDDEVSKKVWREIYDKGKRSRRVGLEFTALSDMVAALGKKFCTEEGNAIVDKVTRLMMSACLDCQVDLAIERGVFPDADIKCEGKNEWFKYIKEEYPERYERMKNHGRRNISFTTAGPTGSLSILTRTSSGIEPLFLPYYVRRRKCMTENDRVDYVDKMGVNFSEFVIVHPQLKVWAKVHYPNLSDDIDNGNLSESRWKELYEESPWYQACAQDIDWRKRVELQSIVQKNLITHSISSTVNLPNKVTEEEVSNIYLEAWRKGLKGITVYRDGSREGIIIQKEQKKEDDKFDSYISAPKRPKTLPADFYVTRVKGETFFVMVGLYHDKPYEIFVYKTHDDEKTSYGQHRGEITKIKRGVYKYTSDLLIIDNINGELTTEELATAIYSSMLLRHAAPLDCIIKTAQKVDDNITSFTAAMTRILKRYLKDTIIEGEVCPDCGGKLIRENGCIRCLDCGWSRCG